MAYKGHEASKYKVAIGDAWGQAKKDIEAATTMNLEWVLASPELLAANKSPRVAELLKKFQGFCEAVLGQKVHLSLEPESPFGFGGESDISDEQFIMLDQLLPSLLSTLAKNFITDDSFVFKMSSAATGEPIFQVLQPHPKRVADKAVYEKELKQMRRNEQMRNCVEAFTALAKIFQDTCIDDGRIAVVVNEKETFSVKAKKNQTFAAKKSKEQAELKRQFGFKLEKFLHIAHDYFGEGQVVIEEGSEKKGFSFVSAVPKVKKKAVKADAPAVMEAATSAAAEDTDAVAKQEEREHFFSLLRKAGIIIDEKEGKAEVVGIKASAAPAHSSVPVTEAPLASASTSMAFAPVMASLPADTAPKRQVVLSEQDIAYLHSKDLRWPLNERSSWYDISEVYRLLRPELRADFVDQVVPFAKAI